MYFYNRRLSTFLYGLLFCLDLTRAQNTQLQTIFSLDIYSSQKPCAQGCFIRGGYCFQDIVGDAIGCVDDNVCGLGSSGLAVNECYCRTDLQAVAESFLTACVKSACTVGDSSIDISSAGSIYNSYCSAALATSVPAATTQEGTSGQPVTTISSSSPPMTSSPLSSGSVPSIPTTIRNNVSSTPTNSGSITAAKPSNTSNSSGSSPLSTGGIIGVAVSIGCSVLSLVFGIVFKIWVHKRGERRKRVQRA